MDNDSNDLTFSYDALSRLTSETQSILGGTGQTVSYEYDDASRLTKITAPSGKDTTYTYDALGRNTTITSSGNTIATYSYTGVLNTGVAYGNGENITYNYDALLRLANLDNGVQNYTYTYDDVSNITSDGIKDYSYDNLYRLAQVATTTGGTTLENYNYDDAGNRTTDIQNTYTTNTLNQYTTLSWATSTTYIYDDNGNIINNGTYTFIYDYKNRVVEVQDANNTTVVEYTYDVLGRRLQKQTADTTTNYIYSNKNTLEETKTTGNKTLTKTYINGLGLDNLLAYIAEEPNLTFPEQEELEFCEARVIPYESTFNTYGYTTLTTKCNDLSSSWSVIVENTYYFHKNHLWSVVGITDDAWNMISEYDYDVFWKVTLINGVDTGNTKLYTGREYDSEIDLYYLRARYYDANLGKFISRDPIGQVDDVNLYAYVGNNPVMYVDLNGLEKQLLQDIENENWFVVELASRNLNTPYWWYWIHTWIIIRSYWKDWYYNEYTIGWHENSKTGMLDGEFNSDKDFIRYDGRRYAWNFKGSTYINTPQWFTDAEFVNNIYDEYNSYEKNQKKYTALSANTKKNNSWNCNNFSTTLLYNASNYDSWVVSSVSDFNPKWANPWLWEAFD